MIKAKQQENAEEAAIRWIARLDSPSLTEAQQQAFFDWLESSPVNQAAYLKVEQLWHKGELLHQLRYPAKSKTEGLAWGWAGTAMMACCALIFVFALFIQNPLGGEEVRHYHTKKGQQSEQHLADNSRIILNTNSAVEVTLEDDRRKVVLNRGEVFFDVAPDENRPFEVITKQGVVRVLGTRFSVYQNDDEVLVTVVEGRVALGSEESEQNFVAITTLTADQRLSMGDAKRGAIPKSLNARNALAWRNKQLVYENQSLSEVVEELNRYFDGQIVLNDEDLNDLEVLVVLEIEDYEMAVSQLASALNLHVDYNDARSSANLSKHQRNKVFNR